MATELKSGSSIKRLVKIHGLDAPVEVEIDRDGLSFRVKGTRKRLSASWYQVVNAAQTPLDVPSFLAGRPIEFLQHQLSKTKNT